MDGSGIITRRQHICWGLEHWASEEEQRRTWLSDGSDGLEVSSYNEALETLFSDGDVSRDLEQGRTVFSISIDFKLKELERLIMQIDGQRLPQEVLADPKMIGARRLASELLDLITALPNAEKYT